LNRTLKDSTIKRYHYETHGQLKRHLHTFLMAYNLARRLKTLRGLAPRMSTSASSGRKTRNASIEILAITPWD